MSKFDLRDISERLTRSKDTEAVVFEFLGYLQAVRSDWRATLAFYEVSADALVQVCERQGNRLVRREIHQPVDELPVRLVRKFFHPSAFFNHLNRASLLQHLFGGSPSYEPDLTEGPALRLLTAHSHWQSCVCLPMADQEDMLALLVITSEKPRAFGTKIVTDLVPVKSMAALALAQQLYRSNRARGVAETEPGAVPAVAAEFQDRLERLDRHARTLEEDNRAKTERLESLAGEIESLDRHSTRYKQELDRVKSALMALEEQSAAANEHLQVAHSELDRTRARMSELQRTVRFMKEVFLVLGEEHDRQEFPPLIVNWFCEHFGIARCSLMTMEPSRETLKIAAQRGLEPGLAGHVRVRVGQGIAGWVAHNKKPLFVRVRDDAPDGAPTGREDYNSDSFVSVPLSWNDRICGVLNLSNKRNGEPFDEYDLDRALLAASVIAMTIGGQEATRRAVAWN